MEIIKAIWSEFINQSANYQGDSLSTRTKRIQTIFKNIPILVHSVVGFGIVRAAILVIEPSSFITTIAFSIFIPVLTFLLISLYIYTKKNPVSQEPHFKLSHKILARHENTIGFYSSIMTFWVILMIPITIYYEEQKFDKGIQFMMAKINLNLDLIILMQPKKSCRFIEVVFTLSYFVMLSIKSFSFIDLFFASGAIISTYFVFYVAEKFNNEYHKLLREKEKMMKLNSETFKMIREPVITVNSSLTKTFFKNNAFSDIQKITNSQDEFESLKKIKNSQKQSLYEVLNKDVSPSKSNLKCKEDATIFSLENENSQNNELPQINFLVQKVTKKLKNYNEEMTAIYFQDIGKEINLKILEGNIEFTSLMLYSLSHEIRTPLNGMKGILHLIKNKNEEKYYKQIKFAISCSEFLVNQINCMMDYSQIIKKEFKLHLEFVNIRQFFKKIAKISSSIIDSKHKSLEITTNVSSTISTNVILDKDRVKQVLLNLLTNAIKYTEKGIISINSVINFQCELEISISDTGYGFNPEDVETFNNLETNNLIRLGKERNKFPGYKLRICQILVSQFQARLKLRSNKNAGSTFTFTISLLKLHKNIDLDVYRRTESGTVIDTEVEPIKSIQRYTFPSINTKLSELNSKYSISLPIKRNKLILIVDDIELNRFVISGMIKKLNFHNLIEATNGKEALDIAKEMTNKNDEFIIFMDIDMPIMDGLVSSKLIREFSNQPIIAITAFIGEEMRDNARKSGMNKFITKPISFSQIKSILKEYNFI